MGRIALLPKNILFCLATCGFIAGCSLLILTSRTAVASRLDAWKVLPRPERLTELYFTQPASLPAVLKPRSRVLVAFTIHNLERRTTTYRYTLVGRAAGTEQPLGTGTAVLGHDAHQDITQTVTIPPLTPRIEIQVRLEYSGIVPEQDGVRPETQSIHYWANTAP